MGQQNISDIILTAICDTVISRKHRLILVAEKRTEQVAIGIQG